MVKPNVELSATGIGVLLALGVIAALWIKSLASGKSIITEAAGIVSEVAGSTVQDIGETVGIPRTNADKCATAKASGSLWEQSLYCPAGDFAGSFISHLDPRGNEPLDTSGYDFSGTQGNAI